MKKIVLACGAGVATSAVVAQKVSALLDAHGLAGAYTVEQCTLQDAREACADADLLLATTVDPGGLPCPYVNGVPFLTGIGRATAEQEVLDALGAC